MNERQQRQAGRSGVCPACSKPVEVSLSFECVVVKTWVTRPVLEGPHKAAKAPEEPPEEAHNPTREIRKLRDLLACVEAVLYGDPCEALESADDAAGHCEGHDCIPCNSVRRLDKHFRRGDYADPGQLRMLED